jgi:hypothetical protein
LSELATAARFAQVVLHGLSSASYVYQLEADGRRVHRGARPGPQWQGHGTFARKLWTLVDGALVRVEVHKQRWRLTGTTRTCHSRPPDDLASVWFCSLVVVTALWGWLRGDDGLHRHEPAAPALSKRPSPRTVQRWLGRSLAHAEATALSLRRAVIDRCEPRPMESYVGGGLSPPRRRWGDPGKVTALRSGLFHLFEGAAALDVHVSLLLAEARGRKHGPLKTWLI